MQSYYDLTEKERANLTKENFDKYVTIELMISGIRPLPTLILEEKKDVPELRKKSYYRVNDFYFKSLEDAEKLVALCPMMADWDGLIGYDYKYAVHFHTTIEKVNLYVQEDILQAQESLIYNKKIDAQNEKLVKEYKQKSIEANKVISEMQENWQKCIDLKKRYLEVLNIQKVYLRNCKDNEEIAMSFLLKIFSSEEIATAPTWI